MKKIVLAAALLLTSVATFAQREVGDFTIQPKVGLNIANTTKTESNYKVDFVGGAEAEYQVGEIFSVSTGLLYSRQGAKVKNSNEKWNPSYINMPVMANVYVVPGLAVKLGLQPGLMIDKDHATEVNTFDLSIPVGLSYEYKNFVLDGRYNFGVTNISKNGNPKNSVFQFTLGYKFDI